MMPMTAQDTDFDDWLVETFAAMGPFTMLFVLLRIEARGVRPLRSAHLHVTGADLPWPEMRGMLDGAGVDWDGAVFWRAGREGLVEDAEARRRLASLVRALAGDRTLIREGEFFNPDGLRLSLDDA